jgi:chromosomal replication initiation ATPase DnaA
MITQDQIEVIIEGVSSAMGITDLRVRSKLQRLVDARSIASYLLHSGGLTYSAIGRLFDQDHTTIMYNVKKIERERKQYPRIDIMVSNFEKQFEGLDARVGSGE